VAHRGVLDTNLVGDHLVTRTFGAKSEDALHQWGHFVGDQFAIHHVVARGWMILPPASFGRLALSHLGVLHDLVAVVLSEDPGHPDLHLARGRTEVEVALVDRVHDHPVRTEKTDEPGEVALVSTEAVPAPDQQVSHLASLDESQQFSHGGTLEIFARPPLVGEHGHGTEVAQSRQVPTALRLGVGRELHLVLS
jgi:hypothetical protein